MNFGSFILGIALLTTGIVMLRFNTAVYGFTGQIDFIESKFPSGTLSAIKLFAIILVFIGAALATGVFSWLTKPLVDAITSTFNRQ